MIDMKMDIEWLEEQRDRLRAVQQEATADLEAVERVIGLWKRSHRSQSEKAARPPVEPEQIVGMKLHDAAIFAASKNGGRITSTALRELAVQAGILEDAPAASTAVYGALNNSDAFEKGAKRGEYRLVNPFADVERELAATDWDSMPEEELSLADIADAELPSAVPLVRQLSGYANGARLSS